MSTFGLNGEQSGISTENEADLGMALGFWSDGVCDGRGSDSWLVEV